MCMYMYTVYVYIYTYIHTHTCAQYKMNTICLLGGKCLVNTYKKRLWSKAPWFDG